MSFPQEQQKTTSVLFQARCVSPPSRNPPLPRPNKPHSRARFCSGVNSPLSNQTSFHNLTVLFGEATASHQPPPCHPEPSPCLLWTAPPGQHRPQGLPARQGPARPGLTGPLRGGRRRPAPRRPGTHPRPAARCTRR